MKQFIIKVARFGIIVSAIIYFITAMIDAGLRETDSLLWRSWNEIYSGEIQADILINGSSRAATHYNTKILERILAVKAYNIGLPGHEFNIQYCRYIIYAENNGRPKLLLHNVDEFMLSKRTNLYGWEQFLPYLDDPVVQMWTSKYIGLSWIQYNIPILKYIGAQRASVIGLSQLFGIETLSTYPRNVVYYKGFHEQSAGIWTGPIRKGFRAKIDPETKELFINYLRQCRNNDVVTVLVYSPMKSSYRDNIVNHDSMMTVFREIAKSNGAKFIDYSKSSISTNERLFYDPIHLNKKGAEIFTTRLAGDLKRIVYNNKSETIGRSSR